MIISLGCCCEVTITLKHMTSTRPNFIFDCISSYDTQDVINAFKRDFENFNVIKRKYHPQNLLTVEEYKSCLIPHYNGAHWPDICKRRVERLKETMSNSDNFIYFIRKNHLNQVDYLTQYEEYSTYSPYTTLQQAIELRDEILKYTSNFLLIIINHVSSDFDLSQFNEWKNIPHISLELIILDQHLDCPGSPYGYQEMKRILAKYDLLN